MRLRAIVLAAVAACNHGGSGATSSDGGVQAGDGGGSGTGSASCLGSTVLGELGASHLVIGVSGSTMAEASAPYDLR